MNATEYKVMRHLVTSEFTEMGYDIHAIYPMFFAIKSVGFETMAQVNPVNGSVEFEDYEGENPAIKNAFCDVVKRVCQWLETDLRISDNVM